MGFLGKKKAEMQNATVIEAEKQAAKASLPIPHVEEDDGNQYRLVKVPVQYGIGVENKETKEVYADAEILMHICNEIAELKQMIIQASK
jgi:hypothetical protein